MTRLAEKNNLSKRAYYDENPPSKKHWSYWYFVKNYDVDEQKEIDPGKYVCMLMNPGDNVENIDEEYVTEILDSLPERERMRFKHGEFTESEDGLIYYAFSREKHVKECEWDRRFPLWAGVDFNVSPMTSTIGQIINGVLYIIDEFHLMNSNTEALCVAMKKKYGNNINVVPDSTGRNRSTNANLSDIQILKQHGFTLKIAPNPYRVDRYAAVNASLEKSKVVLSPKAKYTIKDLESVSYKEGSDQPDTSQSHLLTHCSDNLGYLIFRTINPLKGNIKHIASQSR